MTTTLPGPPRAATAPAVRRPVLVACSHGTADPAGRAAVRAVVDGLAHARPDLDVREAFVDVQVPEVDDVVAQACAAQVGAAGDSSGPPVVVVPLLLSAGYHTHVDVRRAVRGRHAVAAGALGPDPRLVGVLLDRLAEAGADPQDAVVLAAAGSSDDRAAAAVERTAGMLRALRPGPVAVGYGSAREPRVPEAVRALRDAGARRVVVASYLLAPGWFHDRLGEAGADVVTAPLGPDPRVIAVALDRYDRARRDRRTA